MALKPSLKTLDAILVTFRVIAHPARERAVWMGMAMTSRIAWSGQMDRRRAVSKTDLMSAYCFAPHWERNPLVTFAIGGAGTQRAFGLVVGWGNFAIGHEDK